MNGFYNTPRFDLDGLPTLLNILWTSLCCSWPRAMTSMGIFEYPGNLFPRRTPMSLFQQTPANLTASIPAMCDHMLHRWSMNIALTTHKYCSSQVKCGVQKSDTNIVKNLIVSEPIQNSMKGGVRYGVYGKLATDEPKLLRPKASRRTPHLGSRWFNQNIL